MRNRHLSFLLAEVVHFGIWLVIETIRQLWFLQQRRIAIPCVIRCSSLHGMVDGRKGDCLNTRLKTVSKKHGIFFNQSNTASNQAIYLLRDSENEATLDFKLGGD